ncbi:MAG TPA: hypothetical protein PK989_02645 [Anaerolineales bacterium]|nr:hypothetical protein [Anaerolineales bacterium]
MKFWLEHKYRIAVIAVILIAAILRIRWYGNPALSIAGNDTQTYVDASHVPLFSSEIMTGRRLLTTNLVYKFLEPKDGYQILVNGSLETSRRVLQPGFDRITILQLIVSLLGWGALAFAVSERIKNPGMKILSTILILAFGFVPQIADWDSILMSESLAFSLFALQLAILIHLIFSIYKNPDAKLEGWLALWGLTLFFWTFVRDTNLLASLVTLGLVAVLMSFPTFRRSRSLVIALVLLIFISLLGLMTTGASTRSSVSISNVYVNDILSSPNRVAIFQEMGMPAPDSPEYGPWFAEKSTSTLARFMLSHPGYPLTKIIRDFPIAFVEIKQTYFKTPELGASRDVLMGIGDALHPENTTPFVMSLILLIGLGWLAYRNISLSRPWTWLALWLFLSATAAMITSILGDTWGLNRHALFSTSTYRLFMWLFAIVIMDIALDREQIMKSGSSTSGTQ